MAIDTRWQTALQQIRAWQQSGIRIVFTNGVFDLLHAGHVDYLERAASLGDRLVIGLNSDVSVRRIKGDARPIVEQTHRKRLLEALRVVDLVILFDEDTPEKLIRSILPDLLIKGADYLPDQIAGADAVKAAGGEVRTIELVPGLSSSNLIERILRVYGADPAAAP